MGSRGTITRVICLAASVLAVTAAPAAATGIADGTATLELSPGLQSKLERAEVGFSGREGARVRGETATMELSGGMMEGPPATGVAIPVGALRFAGENGSVRFRKLGIDITHGAVGAKVGDAQVRLATFRRVTVARDGFEATLTMPKLQLTRSGAAALNRGLGRDRYFKPGSAFAGMTLALSMKTLKSEKGDVGIALDPGLRAKLNELGVEVLPFSTGVIGPESQFLLPLSYARIQADFGKGEIGTADGLRLYQPSSERGLKLYFLEVDLEANALEGYSFMDPSRYAATTTLATLDSARPAPVTGEDGVSLPPTAAAITSFLAERLDEAFASPLGKSGVFVPGSPLGTVSFSVRF